jgi:hypothetical protein
VFVGDDYDYGSIDCAVYRAQEGIGSLFRILNQRKALSSATHVRKKFDSLIINVVLHLELFGVDHSH